MWISYKDICSRIADTPKWWIDGVPRFCEFSPDSATIYANEVALVGISCQHCGKKFEVAIVSPGQNCGLCGIEYLALHGDLGVGDPPNSGCCAYGAHMGAYEMELLEFWERIDLNWHRLHALEGSLVDADDDPLRRRAAIDYAIRIDKREDYERSVANENVAELAALLTRAGHQLPDIAAGAAIKRLRFIKSRNEKRIEPLDLIS